MNSFYNALTYIDKFIYEPNGLVLTSIQEENQNSDYAAGKFKLNNKMATKTIRFRVAKITPTKVGQFVTFWEKDITGTNQPFQYDDAPELLVITVFKNEHDQTFGQFIFPKVILLEKNILKSSFTKGKMAMRVYPSWDRPTSKLAIQTQNWQLDYFVEISNTCSLHTPKTLALYAQ